MDENNLKNTGDQALTHKLGFWAIWAMGVGAVVGDGIFLLFGEAMNVAGPSSVLGLLIAGLIQMFMMIAMGEFAVTMPNSGAMSVWVEEMFGQRWGFLCGFAFALGWVITGGSTGLAVGIMTCYYFPNLDPALWSLIFAIGWVSLFAILNIFGAELAAKVQLVLVAILIAFMLVTGIAGLTVGDFSKFTPFMPNGMGGFLASIPMGTYSYMGAITLTTSGGECKDPKDMPKALVWSSVTFIVVYTIAQAAVIAVVGYENLDLSVSPFTLMAQELFGPVGANLINTAGLIAAATSILSGTLYAPSRIFYQQAHQGYLPKFFGDLNPRFKTPVKSIIFVWLASVVFILFGRFGAERVYLLLSNQVVVAWCISWGITILAAIKFRRNHEYEIIEAGWKQPLFPLFPVLGLLGIVLILYTSFASSSLDLVMGIISVALIFLFYDLYSKRNIARIKN